MNWQEEILHEVVRLLPEPSPRGFVATIRKQGYQLVRVPREMCPEPFTCHVRRVVVVPRPCVQYQRVLVHEATEILLRTPVAPEYCYIPTWYNEPHRIACLLEAFFYTQECQ